MPSSSCHTTVGTTLPVISGSLLGSCPDCVENVHSGTQRRVNTQDKANWSQDVQVVDVVPVTLRQNKSVSDDLMD